MADGLHVVVRNTFLEFSDDTPPMHEESPMAGTRRQRAMSDLTDSKLPVKVELSNTAGFYEVSRHRTNSKEDNSNGGKGGGATISNVATSQQRRQGGLMGMPTVDEEPGDFSQHDPYGFAQGGGGMHQHHHINPAMHGAPPGDLGWAAPGAGGMAPPYGGHPMWGGGYGYYPGMPAPPFPPGMQGMMPFAGFPQGSGPAPGYGAQAGMGQGFDECGGQHGKGSRRGKGGGGNKAAAFQLSDHLGDGRAAPAGGNRRQGMGGPAPQSTAKSQAPAAMSIETAKQTNPASLTTVMLRNVPNGYTRGVLLEMLNTHGFEGRYDFVYLPMDFRNGVNLGYAFVNLLAHQDAESLTDKLQGFSEWETESDKVCEVSWAHPHQGLREHVERYRNSPVMHSTMPDEYKPMLFRNGVLQPFPQPTKAIKAPKLRLTTRETRPVEEDRSAQSGAADLEVADA